MTDDEPVTPGDATGDSELGADDLPVPETGLHALGQLATGVLVVGALVLTFMAVALVLGWIFR